MLKITLTETPTKQKWALQGRLTHPWGSRRIGGKHRARQGRTCVVDLNDVTVVWRLAIEDTAGCSLRRLRIAGP